MFLIAEVNIYGHVFPKSKIIKHWKKMSCVFPLISLWTWTLFWDKTVSRKHITSVKLPDSFRWGNLSPSCYVRQIYLNSPRGSLGGSHHVNKITSLLQYIQFFPLSNIVLFLVPESQLVTTVFHVAQHSLFSCFHFDHSSLLFSSVSLFLV